MALADAEKASLPVSMSCIGTPELVVIALVLGILGLWIWSLIHCITNRFLTDTNRMIGIVLVAALGLLGSLIYLFLPKEREPQR